ncbi:MAG: hypothetical protein JO100_01900 [Pseudonocardia sp.]|nr:hypothetical protein [Pseudonocardia sp.]
MPKLDIERRAVISKHVRFAHIATLVFPPDLSTLSEYLASLDLRPIEVTRSVVVKERIGRRHGRDLDGTQLSIFRVPVPEANGELELFAPPVRPIQNSRISLRSNGLSRKSRIWRNAAKLRIVS